MVVCLAAAALGASSAASAALRNVACGCWASAAPTAWTAEAFIDTLVIPENVPLTIVVPEFVPARWWQFFLHNQTALRLLGALRSRPNTVVVDVTHQLKR